MIMNNPLLDRYESAMRHIRDCKVNDNDAERVAGKLYQDMVKAGLVMQIKKKYRGSNNG